MLIWQNLSENEKAKHAGIAIQILYAYNKECLSSYEQKFDKKICPSAFVPSNNRILNQSIYYFTLISAIALSMRTIIKRKFDYKLFIGVPLILGISKDTNYRRFLLQERSRSSTLQKYGKEYLESDEEHFEKVKMILDPRTSHYDLKRLEL